MSGRIDRRAARTRRLLHEAMMRLILERGYEQITVQDIIDAADVGRSTFYAHFTGKDDLLRAGFEGFRKELLAQGLGRVGSAGPLGASLALFAHALEFRPIYAALMGGRGGALADARFRLIVEEFLGHAGDEAGDLPAALRTRFAVDTFLVVLNWAFAQKPSPTPESLDATYRRLLHYGLGPRPDGID